MDDDMLLARYVDNEMDEGERIAFEQDLAKSPALAARLDAWRMQDRAVAADISQMFDDLPYPHGLDQPASPSAISPVRPDRPVANRPPPGRQRKWLVPAALAASLALVVALSIQFTGSRGNMPLDALEQLPTGQSVALADGTNLTAVLTFASGDGRWCREYTIGVGAGIACRTEGTWQAEVEVASAQQTPADSSTAYATAGVADNGALDAAYDRLRPGDPLGLAEEAAVMDDGWASAAP